MKLLLPTGSGTKDEIQANNVVLPAGKFLVQTTLDWTGMDVSLDNGEYSFMVFSVSVGGESYSIVLGKWAPDDATPNPGPGTGYDFQDTLGGSKNGANVAAGADVLRFERTAANELKAYFNAVEFSWGTVAGVGDFFLRVLYFGGGTKPSIQSNFASVLAQDGDGNDLYVPVATWTDQTANNNDALQATLADRPAYVPDIANGYAGTRFDGSDTMAAAFALPQPFTLHIAAKITKPGSTLDVLGDSNASLQMTSDGYAQGDAGSSITDDVDLDGVMHVYSLVADPEGLNANDDFSGATINSIRWTEISAAGGTMSI